MRLKEEEEDLEVPVNKKWKRYRFKTDSLDYKPIIFVKNYPYWSTGAAANYYIMVAYLPSDDDILKYWPESFDIDWSLEDKIVFTDRFRRPSWYEEEILSDNLKKATIRDEIAFKWANQNKERTIAEPEDVEEKLYPGLERGTFNMIFSNSFFNPTYLKKVVKKKPRYVMGVDDCDKNALAYCLSKELDGIVEVLLIKVFDNEEEFKQEVDNLAKYFNAIIYKETK